MKRRLGCLVLIALIAAVGGARAQEDSVSKRGWRLFVGQGCYGCHTIGPVGTPIGPDLTRVGSKYSEARLVRWLTDPEAERPGAHMPVLELSRADINALAAFLAGFID